MKNMFLPEARGGQFLTLIGVTAVGSPAGLIAGYLLAVNLWAFGLMWFDKRRSKRAGARRIRERTLFLSALLGGSLGALLGMWVFRHKTKHWYFVWGMPAILLAQLAAVYWLWR